MVVSELLAQLDRVYHLLIPNRLLGFFPLSILASAAKLNPRHNTSCPSVLILHFQNVLRSLLLPKAGDLSSFSFCEHHMYLCAALGVLKAWSFLL